MKTLWMRLGLALLAGFLLLSLGRGMAANAQQGDDPTTTTTLVMPVLQNSGFDNHRWYEFNDRYGTWLKGSWVPDDDDGQRLQDWRLWYMRGTPLLKAFPESGVVHTGVESVVLRSYDGNVQEGGLYQVIYNVTPCLQYQFQMHALSRPDTNVSNPTAELRVGLDPTGWHSDPAVDPAVPGYYPASIVWSAPQDFKYPTFGLLQVTAEALSDKVTVYTRALAYGGVKHAVVWDTGEFQEVTPAMLHDPAALPPASLSPIVITSTGSVQISWATPASAVSQVYYRQVPAGGETPPDYPHKVYLPLVMGGSPSTWIASPINKTPAISHSIWLTGLSTGQIYEYIAVSRGLSGSACVTWVSSPQRFTAP